MSAVTASLCSTLVFVLVFASASADQKIITAESGQDVTLTCGAPNNNKIIVVKWSRADLGDKHVLLYRDGHFAPANQHPSFKNRVDLQDRQMKDGDVSLILKDVTINDTGTYKCRVFMETRSWELISIINLTVAPPGQPGWSVGLKVGVAVSALFLCAAVLLVFNVGCGGVVQFLMEKRVKRCLKRSHMVKLIHEGDECKNLADPLTLSLTSA